ncbi:Pentatricopeptide repeat-containing protein [Acorus gramineus]|uniref:Pentatricopeptide repeat-containing protein n=1 Tax=Acorus gramineus TaxID=55184 RepID=A0AAV8ZWA0_ACOGR|nr:Pentatricopeptide repeat-containing protein [Acorus gramineus]
MATLQLLQTQPTRTHPDHPILSLLDDHNRPPDRTHIKKIHARMLRLGLLSDPYSASRLIAALSLSPSRDLHYAHQLFDQIPHPNLFTWNALIRAFASSSTPLRSLLVFLRLLSEAPLGPDKFTFPFVIKAAADLPASRFGRAVHAMVLKSALRADVFIGNSLIYFYAACGDLGLSRRVFDGIPVRDVVSWNSMIAASTQAGRPEEALELFRRMEVEDVKPNDVTMTSVVNACAQMGDLELGMWVCSYTERNVIRQSLILNNAMLDMYAKCGNLEEARKLFDAMGDRDSFTWTTMLVGYASDGDFKAARRVFEAMPSRDIAAWNAMISAYGQSGQPKEALGLFHECLKEDIIADQVTFVSVLSVCSQLGTIDLGRLIHASIHKHGITLNCHLATSLIDMYAKCGNLEKAVEVFQSVDQRDVFVWSAMMAGLAMHGHGEAAIELFLEMQEAKVKPNEVTFMNMLCACSHSGLVDKGRIYLNQMLPVYGIAPKVEHYGCMVDILGRAGRLDEALDLIENQMPMPPRASVWGALLGACAVHGNVKLGEKAFEHLVALEPGNDGAYVLMSNLYAKSDYWDGVAKLRKRMREMGMKKEKGCSSIEVDGVVYDFLVGDISHPSYRKIYLKLNEIASRLRSSGYVPNRSQLLQNVEDDDAKEQALYLHSEKLAIAFGLISTDSCMPIRVMKNLRVCEDCHSFAKVVSSVYEREVVLRDRYRFHRFRGGECSCMDYW